MYMRKPARFVQSFRYNTHFLTNRQTDSHMTTANAVLALRRAVKMHVLNINATPSNVLAFLPRTCTTDFKTKCNSLTN